MHSTSTRLEQVPLDKVVKAWLRFLVEILLYAVFIFYAVTFMTHTLTRFAQTYTQVFTKHRQQELLWKDYCRLDLERHTQPECEDARKYLLVNPHGRVVNLVVQDMPFLGVCGKSETCWHAAVEGIQLLVSWPFVLKMLLLTFSIHVLARYLGPALFGAARYTKTYKATQRGIVSVPVPVS